MHGVRRGAPEPAAEAQVALLEVVVADEAAEGAVKAITSAANTGKIGDGKVFLSSIDEAIRIRTDETGNEAL